MKDEHYFFYLKASLIVFRLFAFYNLSYSSAFSSIKVIGGESISVARNYGLRSLSTIISASSTLTIELILESILECGILELFSEMSSSRSSRKGVIGVMGKP